MRIAILCAAFNRSSITVRGLQSVVRTMTDTHHDFEIILLDDSSPDDTVKAVKSALPQVRVISGTGNLYWTRGMHKAYEASLESGSFDAYILFNDDVELKPDKARLALREFELLNRDQPSIVVGSTMSSFTNETTYSAFREVSKLRALAFEPIGAVSTNTSCDTFNGNFVILPGAFLRSVNGLDTKFHHGLGDIDLGLVAKLHGIPSILFHEAIGYCEKGPTLEERLQKASILRRFDLLFRAPNGLGPYCHFVWKHRPRIGFPLYVALSFAKRAISLLSGR